MRTLYSILLALLLLAFIPRCASPLSQEAIFSDPPQAEIYWGKTQSSLEKTGLKTPNSRSLSASTLEGWCYQLKKSGYYDSEITCRGEEGFRYLNFHLIPIKTTITSEPPGAIVFWGETKDRLERTDFRTPKVITVKDLPIGSGADLAEWYFQVRKEGYHDSEIIFSPPQQLDRNLHFMLSPLKR
jgi:hypothetical protein